MFTEKTYASFYRYEIHRYTALFSLETIDMAPSTNRITLRLPKNTLEELKKEANEKDILAYITTAEGVAHIRSEEGPTR